MTIVQSALIFELPSTEFLLGGESREAKKRHHLPEANRKTRFVGTSSSPPKKKKKKNERNISGKHHQIYLWLESTNLDFFFLKIAPHKKYPILVSFSWVAARLFDGDIRKDTSTGSRKSLAMVHMEWFFSPTYSPEN